MTWIESKLREAYTLAQESPDLSTQNAALAFDAERNLVGRGVNRLTKGVEATADRLARPAKYLWTEHAERSALYDAHRAGKQAHILVCPWAACADCARAIVQMNVLVLVRHVREDFTGRWGESIEVGDEILRSGGVEIVEFHGPLDADPIRFNGEVLEP